jgi:hypothetical protein
MRTTRWTGMLAVAVAAMALWPAGCGDWLNLEGDCVALRTCCADGTLDCLSTVDGGDGGPPLFCIPSTVTTPVADTCGVFVSSSMGSDTTGKGTKEAPYQTLTKALGAANGQPVYACGEAFAESVALAAPANLYGALACASGWTYNATQRTSLTAGSNPIPLSLSSSASGSAIHDFTITVVDATAAGTSSIAVLDDHADLTLENVDVSAGVGAPGAPGMAQSQVTTPASANGSNGSSDGTCMNTANILGGAGGTNTCDGTLTNGGNGGKGIAGSAGDNGVSGQPMTPNNGGAGQTTTACQAGGTGNEATGGTAAAGMLGTGARGIGDVSTSGYQPPAAALGTAGSNGQGGGGGGGAHACDTLDTYAGPSGGGGGAGGCGGAPGNPGTSGGSSIGIVALGATLTLTGVSITTHDGGAGGLGAAGQQGAGGGLPGNAGAVNACGGGAGGQGGAGGPGGGGAGGHSIGVAMKGGTAPDLSQATITLGGAGPGGSGADMTAMTKGDTGMACKALDFTPASTMPCMM